MKNIFEKLVKHIDETKAFRDHASSLYQDGEDVLPYFEKFMTEHGYDTTLGNDIAELLQLSNNEKILEQISLQDIDRLFDSLISNEKSNLDICIEAAHFNYSVLENNEKARSMALEGIRIAEEKLVELNRVITLINQED